MAPGSKAGSFAPKDRDIFGLATHESYGRNCRQSAGALLPHLFTLIRGMKHPLNGYFLLRGFKLSPDFPLGSMVPFVARTFLPGDFFRRKSRSGAIERSAATKIDNFGAELHKNALAREAAVIQVLGR